MFKNIENRRSIVAINLKYRPKTNQLKNFFLYKGLNIYNNLEKEFKTLNTIKFKNLIKNSIKNKTISDTMD